MSVPDISVEVAKKVSAIGVEMRSRAVRGSRALKNAELQVLSGQRGGRVYKKPNTYGKRASSATKKLLGDYGHALRGGQLYRASAPGEPPAARGGALLGSFRPTAKTYGNPFGGAASVYVAIETDKHYAGFLEDGTRKMAARPYAEKIKQQAEPEITAIFGAPYNV